MPNWRHDRCGRFCEHRVASTREDYWLCRACLAAFDEREQVTKVEGSA